MSTFGENIKKYRLLKNLSQKQLGEKVGFSARSVSDWECNNTEPNIETIKKLIKVLDISLDELFDF
ncbi:MAG: helix-turn-helix transcriptional regulator [Clostridia bacterium]|nr:helix-turn-helix transcriptional regulator [Clostridia bacterium]